MKICSTSRDEADLWNWDPIQISLGRVAGERVHAGREPVSQLLEDYALFIESGPDHVINSALKKLWLDQDYRKWRD